VVLEFPLQKKKGFVGVGAVAMVPLEVLSF
jgi:hypothetical protein